MSTSQNHQVLDWMKTHGTITTLQAYNELGITRLGARIADIKNGRGVPQHDIDGAMIDVVNRDGVACRVKSYRLADPKQAVVHELASQNGFMKRARCGHEDFRMSCVSGSMLGHVNCPRCLSFRQIDTAGNR